MNSRLVSRFAILWVAGGGVWISNVAHAQSSVTLYGILDSGVEYLSNAASSSGGANLFRLNTGNRISSRFGFRAEEDLGGGLKAIVKLESGINMTNGTLQQGGRLFGREASIGIASSYGQITMGRLMTPIYEYFLPLDPLNYSSYGLPAQDGQFIGRADNAVKFTGTYGAFDVNTMYSFGYDSTVAGGGPVPGSFRVGKQYDIGARYRRNGLQFAAVYEQRQGQSVAQSGKDEQRAAFGGSYNFANWTLYGGYEWFQSDLPTTAQHHVMAFGGMRYNVSAPLSVAAAAYYHDISSVSQRPYSVGLNADYLLSKRTSLYADVTYVHNGNNSKLGATGFGAAIQPGKDQAAVAIGVVHRF